MSGLEVIGVVLGSIPLLVSALESYKDGIGTIRRIRHHAKVMSNLSAALSTEEAILRNTCETLLGGIVHPKDMTPLLEIPFGPLWRDPEIEARVERRLGHTLEEFMALVRSMEEAVKDMRLKLGLGHNFETKTGNQSISRRGMIVIALQASTHQESIKRLADINMKLHVMMAGNLQNEPHRIVYSQDKLFNLLQAVSRSIYNALRYSLSCTCAHSHGVGFGLPKARAIGRMKDEEVLLKRLDFHLILENKSQSAKGKELSSWVWDELVLRLAETPMKTCTTTALPAVTDVPAKKLKFTRVKFLGGDISTAILPTTSPLGRGESTMDRISSLAPETRQLVHVKDICHTLSSKRSDVKGKGSYGYLLDMTAQAQQRFEMFPFESSTEKDEGATIRLGDVFTQGHRPSLLRKYHIAAVAASGVLSLHNTLWMPATLTTKDVFLISRHGEVDFDEIYFAKKSLHDTGGSTMAPSHSPSSEEAGIPTLLYLGIFLAEVMLWKPACEFWDDEDVDLSGVRIEDVFDYRTAKGFDRIKSLLERIEFVSSPEFMGVVKHCIKCDLNARKLSLDDDTFRQAIYSHIVLPLQDADRIVSGKMTAG
ncbi:putative mitochondrial ATP synthase gamma subunit-like protein [Rosellinia necatrix]|uniref:Putative mitochondrial ATP synthase gamma subunit-like protein n=1 Tax=Rosellinia necatrix TaxID=77044 RepID=A0A1S7UL14_ROSNE|nr:putative mitochondrial ATP synthase gamma subunit-like protein [Rosellinia necatrix]